MTDIAALQSDILAQISGAADEAALEAVRVSTLGKKGSVSALLATMGELSPEERKVQGPLFNEQSTEARARLSPALPEAVNRPLLTVAPDAGVTIWLVGAVKSAAPAICRLSNSLVS